MKKQLSILSLGLILAGSHSGFSQETRIQPCNTYAAMEAHFAEDPAARTSYEAGQKKMFEAFLESEKHRAQNRTTAVEYTVPVVFHILHTGGPENISDAACIAALQQVNEDYARLGSDTNLISPSYFKTRYIPSDIKFMLAKKDPQGNCINGIVRHIDAKKDWSQTLAQQASYWTYTWDPTRYLNIYIVGNIQPQGTVVGGGIIVGYTYRPNTWPTGNAHDAIVYRYNYLSPGPPAYQARSLSHEIGHWLNLGHTFGNTNNPGVNCGDDGLGDTPVTKGNFAACPSVSTNSNITCATNVTLYWQNPQNIMDYSSCPKNFTQDQTNSMRNTLISAVNGRNNLNTPSNLGVNYTDVNGLGICKPTAEFLSSTNVYTVCSGGSLLMKDFSFNGNIVSYQWTAGAGAVIATPNASNTNITFNTPGSITVTLTVTNAQGSDSRVRTVTVINGAAAISGPYVESFENPGLPANWTTEVIPSVGGGWQQATTASYHGNNSYYVDGTAAITGQTTNLQMPTIDLLNNQSAVFSFKYTYQRSTATQNDVFRLQMSKDCGGTWVNVVTKSANVMANETSGISNTPYFPSDTSKWKTITPSTAGSWSSFLTSPSVWIRYQFEVGDDGPSNNFFIDAITLSMPTGVNELTRSIGLNLYPNPTSGESTLKFSLSDAANLSIGVVDILGKEIIPVSNLKMPVGEQSIVINKGNLLPKGVYFVNLTLNGTKMSRKLIVE